MSRQLLVGTNNPHKVREIAALLEGVDIQVVGPRQLGIADEPAEDGEAFADNALIKARFFAQRAARPCLADDSGLVVDALDGRPGVYSSRYAPTDEERIARLLSEMQDVPAGRRQARFVCAVALVDAQGNTLAAKTGTCEGVIALEPRGQEGFGYDPVFFLPDADKTMAELSSDEKNARSHRGNALAAIRQHLLRLFS